MKFLLLTIVALFFALGSNLLAICLIWNLVLSKLIDIPKIHLFEALAIWVLFNLFTLDLRQIHKNIEKALEKIS